MRCWRQEDFFDRMDYSICSRFVFVENRDRVHLKSIWKSAFVKRIRRRSFYIMYMPTDKKSRMFYLLTQLIQ